MDEPTLRGIISTMAKNIIPKFEIALDPKSRMKLVLEELGYEKFVLELGLESEERDYPRKNEEVNSKIKCFLLLFAIPKMHFYIHPSTHPSKNMVFDNQVFV